MGGIPRYCADFGAAGRCGSVAAEGPEVPVWEFRKMLAMMDLAVLTGKQSRTGKPGRAERNKGKLRASGGTADALASGASVRKGVGVQIPPRARRKQNPGLRTGVFAFPGWLLLTSNP